jgi:hypothetical protein
LRWHLPSCCCPLHHAAKLRESVLKEMTVYRYKALTVSAFAVDKSQ